ncbi:hypothetical protein PMAYCL1PPCAC_19909, partial [Pristionchus mayeri]
MCLVLLDETEYDDLKKEGSISDGEMTIEIRFWFRITKPAVGIKYYPWVDFTDSSDPCHDVAL